eukprot:13329171-Alexandrium_andersonii.AAC.1
MLGRGGVLVGADSRVREDELRDRDLLRAKAHCGPAAGAQAFRFAAVVPVVRADALDGTPSALGRPTN